MAKINLTEEEKARLIDLINNGSEIPLEILQKLGPGFFDKLAQEGKFDFATLEKFKIPTLEYAGKRAENVILASASFTGGNAPLQVERCFESGNVTNGKNQLTIFEESRKEDKNWRNLIVQGDNLQFLKTCYLNKDPLIKDKVRGEVKLIYIDPPFATKSDFQGSEEERSYSDKVQASEFIENTRERLLYLRNILSQDGAILIHLDYRMASFIKVIMDEIFGKENFVNEMIWSYRSGGASKTESLPRKHDNILFYRKSNSFKVNSKKERQYLGKPFMGSKQDVQGRYYVDTLLRDVIEGMVVTVENETLVEYNTRPVLNLSFERTDYPTQKPEGLLQLIIDLTSNKDDLVLDAFAGSGTTGAVAEKLGRRWIMCDFGKHSIYTMQKRLLRIAESKKLGQEAGKSAKYGQGPMPFCIASCGGYDFTRIMYLRESKDAYIAFVLGLFNLSKTEEDYTRKYKLPNVFAEKEGNPVEVYPVWKDEYLKNVKVDKEYLQEIIDQSGGKLKGDYYIITPVSCTSIGDTVLENEKHEPVRFKILSFPYKILEEAARSFEIKEQPSSSANINDLITSVGFYFNEQVDVKVKKTSDGIQITKFASDITDKNGNKFEGLNGLAMVLIDKDYDGKVFDMEEAVYAVDIKEDGKITIGGVTADTNIIAIDKHGNESKITAVK